MLISAHISFNPQSGHLAKLGGKLKTWRKRWFVLKNGMLTYWKSQHDVNRKPQGQILLDDQCRITKADGASTFEIDTGKKIYYLTADSMATLDDWIRVLQNVQRRNAAKLLLARDDQKPTVQGWVTKVKNGHPKKCWAVLIGRMFMYFKGPGETVSVSHTAFGSGPKAKNPGRSSPASGGAGESLDIGPKTNLVSYFFGCEQSPLGQINMRDARVEEVEHVSDSDSEEREDFGPNQAHLTIAIYPAHQGPTYLILPGKQERDNWLYHLTVVSGGCPNSGTQYEQLVQKLMETDGDPSKPALTNEQMRQLLCRHNVNLPRATIRPNANGNFKCNFPSAAIPIQIVCYGVIQFCCIPKSKLHRHYRRCTRRNCKVRQSNCSR